MLHLRLDPAGLHELVALVDLVLLALRQLLLLALKQRRNSHLLLLLLPNRLQRLRVVRALEDGVKALLQFATLPMTPPHQTHVQQRPVRFILVAENHILDDCARHSQELGDEEVDIAAPVADCRLYNETIAMHPPSSLESPPRPPFDPGF